MKTILIAGASGFVGQYLSRAMIAQGHRVTGLGTSRTHPMEKENDWFTWVCADTTTQGDWQDHVSTADVIINLAGRSIFKPWTKSYKQAIRDSRILTTQNLVNALPDAWQGHLISTSAVGYYGDRGETVLTEADPGGQDFLAQVCKEWEAQALKAEDKGAKVCLMRFGVVLGHGGALDVMGRAFKFFMGGPLGSGNHWFPWIHIQDIARAVDFILAKGLDGAFNFTGPEPIRQKDFARALGKALHRPAITPAPAFMVKLVMGELGASLLQSQQAFPRALENKGFSFAHKTAAKALEAIYSD
jgi:uncharacterized protein (TIGR01777 family)